LLVHEDAGHVPGRPAQWLPPPPAWKPERLPQWPLQEVTERHPGQFELTFLGLLPGAEDLVPDAQLLHDPERRLGAVWPLRQRGNELPHEALRQMEEANGRFEARLRASTDETFRLVTPGFRPALSPTVRLWIEAAEGPALPVLDRRPVGVQEVPLIQEGV